MKEKKFMIMRRIEEAMTNSENPFFLSIIDNSGGCLFSKSFDNDKDLNDQYLGFFLSAMRQFSNTLFNNNFNRVRIGDYHLTLKEQTHFFYCYIYQGRSYEGHRRLNRFVSLLKKFQTIWNALNEYHKTGRILSASNIAQLELITSEVF
ncbi:MAG: hypothetical protein ACW98I_12340 [Candidatus Hodarchaeales archaeon]